MKNAEELAERYEMQPHVENGSYLECHYEHTGEGRAASGSIYYYVGAQEITAFHVIDCDEYWCYNAGTPLEVWQADPDGAVRMTVLGAGEGCEPLIYLKSGVKFASRHAPGTAAGTFLTCITVPRFSAEGFAMIPDDEMLRDYPALRDFFRE